MAVSPFLRPVGAAAAGLAIFQALVWGTLALLGMLASQEVYEKNNTSNNATKILYKYIYDEKDKTLPLFVVYMATSVLWLVVSGLLLHNLLKSKYRFALLVLWATVTSGVCVLDFVASIIFGLDFGKKQEQYVDSNETGVKDFSVPLAPLVLMLLTTRGFILWLVNEAAVVYISIAAHKLGTRNATNKDMLGSAARRMSDSASMYGSTVEDLYSRANPAFQPEPLSAWNIQSPTVGETKRGPWNFVDNPSPVKVFPRIGRPVSAPSPPISPLPIPHPDYSPPLGRPVRHEPNMYDGPLRSALKKPAPIGRTIL